MTDPSNTPKPDRDRAVWAERKRGDIYRIIAERHGISKERVRMICVREARRERWRAERLPFAEFQG